MKQFIAILALSLFFTVSAAEGRQNADGLANATILVIRHAEKPDEGSGLSPAGQARALAYATYFKTLTIDGVPIHIDTLIATADSGESERPRLTLAPLSEATGIQIQQPFDDAAVKDLARWLEQGKPDRTILIAWHHGKLPKLLERLGVNPSDMLPKASGLTFTTGLSCSDTIATENSCRRLLTLFGSRLSSNRVWERRYRRNAALVPNRRKFVNSRESRWPVGVPVGDLLEGMAGAAQQILRHMAAHELHAERHAGLVHAVRQRDGRAAGEIERRSKAQDAQEHARVLSIGHPRQARDRHRHRRDQQQVDLFEECL